MVRTPLVSDRSLMDTGMPWSAPSGAPDATIDSARRAASIAESAVSVQNALTSGFTRSIRASTASHQLDR